MQLTQDIFAAFRQDLLDSKINLISPFIGELGCHVVYALTDTLDPLTALAVGILVSLSDLLCGLISTGCNTGENSLNDRSYGMVCKVVIPLALLSACGTPIASAALYLTINIAARVLVTYTVAT